MATTRREFVQRAGVAASAGCWAAVRQWKTHVCGVVSAPNAPVCTNRQTFQNWAGTIQSQPN